MGIRTLVEDDEDTQATARATRRSEDKTATVSGKKHLHSRTMTESHSMYLQQEETSDIVVAPEKKKKGDGEETLLRLVSHGASPTVVVVAARSMQDYRTTPIGWVARALAASKHNTALPPLHLADASRETALPVAAADAVVVGVASG